MHLTFRSFNLLVSPTEQINLSEPEQGFSFDPEVEISNDYRVVCSVLDENERFKWFEFYETAPEKDYRGLIGASDLHKTANVIVFLSRKQMDDTYRGLSIVSANPFFIQVQGIPEREFWLAKDRRIFGIELWPTVSISKFEV